MNPPTRHRCFALGLALCVWLASCGGADQNELESIQVSPATGSIAAGTTQAFVATGLMTNGKRVDLTLSATWSSTNETVAWVAGSVVNGLAPGTTTIHATDPATGTRGGSLLTVTDAVLVSLALTPPTPQIALGTDVQLTAMGTFSDSSTQDLTGSLTWVSSNGGAASIAAGFAQSVGVGATTITATDPGTGIDASVPLVVTAAVLTSIAITPPDTSIALGTTQQLTATGTFSDSTTQDLTASIAWGSSSPTVAAMGNTPGTEGLASSVGLGTTTVSATDSGTGVSGTTTLTVTAARLVLVAVTPAAPSVALGTSQQFTATGTYTDSSTQDLTNSVTWTSTNGAVAAISNAGGSEGLATSLAVGTTQATATDPDSGTSGSTSLTVTAAVLISVDVTPSRPSIALGTEQSFTATGTYSDASTQDLTTSVTWSSSAVAVAAVSNAPGTEGLATSLDVGSTNITATDSGTGIDGSTTLTVTSAALVSIAVTPGGPSIPLGTAQPFTATGTFTDASTQDLTTSVTWSSDTPATATVSNAGGSEGLASSVAIGVTTVTATDPATSIEGSTTLTVTPAALASIAVTPADPSIALGTNQPFTATGTFTDASTQDLTTSVTWSSDTPATATVSNAGGSEGLASSVAIGVTTVTATHPGTSIDGSTTLTVSPAALASIVVTPATASITTGSTEPFTATGVFTDGSTQDLTTSVTWSSTAPSIATVSNALASEGLVNAAAVGSTTITATDSGTGTSGSTTLSVIANIEFVGAGAASSPTALDLDVPTPAGTMVNDVLVAAIAIRPSTVMLTPPPGWTLVRRMDNATGASNSLVVFRRVASANEPTVHRWSLSSSTGSVGSILSFRGVDRASPLDVEDGASTSSATVHAAPSVTTSVTRTMLVTAHAFSSSSTWTPPAGMTEAVDVASLAPDQATGIAMEVNYALRIPAGITGARSAIASSNPDTGNTHALALSPGP